MTIRPISCCGVIEIVFQKLEYSKKNLAERLKLRSLQELGTWWKVMQIAKDRQQRTIYTKTDTI